MLNSFGPDIWIADGPVVMGGTGFLYPTRMAVMRLGNDDLIVWSPVALTDALRAAVDALGTVRYLAPPNSLHHVFLTEWQRAYPAADVFAPPGLREKCPGVRFTGGFGDNQIAAWAAEVELVIVPGNAITTEIIFFHRSSGTALFTDLLQHFPRGWFKGWRALVARLDPMVADEPSVPRKFRVAFRDKDAARAAVRRILEWPTQQVLMAHGALVTANGQALLRRAFRWLVRD